MRADSALRQLYANHEGKSSDKWEIYLDAYDELLEKHRGTIRSMLEIGVQNGGSLDIWGKYFPSCQKIVGVDIDPKVAGLKYSDDRIQVLVGDAASDATVNHLREAVPQGFDLIIDDGSHRSSDIIKTFIKILPQLNSGGLYIAEDLHCSYWESWEGGLYAPHSSIAFFKLLVDIVNYQHWGLEVPRSVLMDDYLEKLGLEIEDIQLAGIVEVRFLNSLCIVKKMDPQVNNLGTRVIVGDEQAVRDNSDAVQDAYSPPLQHQNQWSQPSSSGFEIYRALERSREEQENLQVKYNEVLSAELDETRKLAHQLQLELNAAKSEIQSYSQDVQALRSSWSWRLTTPLRHIAAPIVGLWRKKNTVAEAVKLGGGVLPTVALTLQVVRKEGMGGVLHRIDLANASAHGNSEQSSYADWLARNDPTDPQTLQRLAEEVGALKLQPLISVVMPVYNPPIEFLDKAIQSVRGQVYSNWELCIADDASTDEAVKNYLQEIVRTDARIKVVFRSENGHISAATNSALDIANGEFVALLDNDDELTVHALAHIVIAINSRPDVDVIYSDEDKIDANGLRRDPYFKSEFNYELFLAQNLISHLGVYRRAAIAEVSGFRLGVEGAQDWDLAFRVLEISNFSKVVHIPRVLYNWRAYSGSTALDQSEKPYVANVQLRVVSDHLNRVDKAAVAVPAPEVTGMVRVRFALPIPAPKISVIVPTRDRVDLLRMCISSIVERTTYENYEILIVDNESIEEEALRYLNAVQSKRIRVIRVDMPFNYSSLNNIASNNASGELLCLLNNDIEIISRDWMDELASFAMQPGVGCVGARLWYPDDTLQHAGVVIGLGGVANHAFKNFSKGDAGYFGRAALHQSYSAVTGACLMVRKSIYEEVGGLDEMFAVAFNDIDFCLRVRERGYRNVWTPYAEMYHHESATRGLEDKPEKIARFDGEVKGMQLRWGNALLTDPAYSPNLTIEKEDFSRALVSRV